MQNIKWLKTKKAQLTMFIIIGIVLFIVFGSLFYVSSYYKQKQFVQEKEELEGLFHKQGKYYSYVYSCMEQ